MNNIVITGRLTADPKIMDTKNGNAVHGMKSATSVPGLSHARKYFPTIPFFVSIIFGSAVSLPVITILFRYTAEVIVDRHEFMESRKEEERNRYKRGK